MICWLPCYKYWTWTNLQNILIWIHFFSHLLLQQSVKWRKQWLLSRCGWHCITSTGGTRTSSRAGGTSPGAARWTPSSQEEAQVKPRSHRTERTSYISEPCPSARSTHHQLLSALLEYSQTGYYFHSSPQWNVIHSPEKKTKTEATPSNDSWRMKRQDFSGILSTLINCNFFQLKGIIILKSTFESPWMFFFGIYQ